jgi:hypothetical protein
MKDREFNPTEAKILRLLYKTMAPLTIYEISKEIGVSYVTAKKYVLKLNEENFLVGFGQGKKLPELYEFNFVLVEKWEPKKAKKIDWEKIK